MQDNDDKPVSFKRRGLCAGGLGLAALGPLALSGCGGSDAGAGDSAPTRVLSGGGSSSLAAARRM